MVIINKNARNILKGSNKILFWKKKVINKLKKVVSAHFIGILKITRVSILMLLATTGALVIWGFGVTIPNVFLAPTPGIIPSWELSLSLVIWTGILLSILIVLTIWYRKYEVHKVVQL